MKNKKLKKSRLWLYTILAICILGFTPVVTGLYLTDLEDVTIVGILDNQHLIYDSATANWTNENFVGGADGYAGDMAHPHNQDLNDTSIISAVSFNSGQGNYELFAMNQDVETTDTPTFVSIDTGDGQTELYTADHSNLVNLYTTIGLSALTSGEVDQLENIGIHSISNSEWGTVADMNQEVGTDDNVEFDNIIVDDNTGDSSIVIRPTTGNDAELVFADADHNERWRWYMDDTNDRNILLKNEEFGNLGLQCFYQTGIPTGVIFWGFDIAGSPGYGITLGTIATAHDKGYAYDWIATSDPLLKELFVIPNDKLFRLADLIKIYGYYNKDHYYDENGEIVILETNYTTISIGVNAVELYNAVINDGGFSEKVALSLVSPPNENTKTWGASYRVIELVLIESTRRKVDMLWDEVFG